MKIDKEYLVQLVLFEISGKIHENEKVQLHQIISDDPEAHSIYVALYNTYTESKLQDIRDNLGSERVWDAINKKKRRAVITKTILSIAAIFLIGIGSLYYSNYEWDNALGRTTAKHQDHIQLQLANGQSIDLSKSHGQVQLGNLVLNNKNNQLSYTSNTQNDQLASITVPVGKNYTILLQDGTEVQLNAATRLDFSFSFTGKTREIGIQGEAYLKIAKDASRPFIVHLPHSSVRVLGTEFNVNTYDSGVVKVALVEGAVSMKTASDSTMLKPGYEISFTQTKGLKIEKFDAYDVLAWRQGIHLFDAASIEEIAKLIQRYYGISVQVDPSSNSKKPFTGSLDRNKPVENFLEGLKFSEYLDYNFDKEGVLHLR